MLFLIYALKIGLLMGNNSKNGGNTHEDRTPRQKDESKLKLIVPYLNSNSQHVNTDLGNKSNNKIYITHLLDIIFLSITVTFQAFLFLIFQTVLANELITI
jgi:hypothetical protein